MILPLDLLRCPVSHQPLRLEAGCLVSGGAAYPLSSSGVPLFAAQACSSEGRSQQRHYDRVAAAYITNLGYPHTRAYSTHMDATLRRAMAEMPLDCVAEICCGAGELRDLIGDRIGRAVGVDVSEAMLERARERHAGDDRFAFVQGDATMLPLADESFSAVVMLGGVHHVLDRKALFAEVARVLKPGGWFVFREPVSDFLPWRFLRSVIYRISPALDHQTERPLLRQEIVPVLEGSGLACQQWRTMGFLGFCLLMNSDVLVFNRLFRFVPGIVPITTLAARFDDWIVSLPGMHRAGLQVVGVARKGG